MAHSYRGREYKQVDFNLELRLKEKVYQEVSIHSIRME